MTNTYLSGAISFHNWGLCTCRCK